MILGIFIILFCVVSASLQPIIHPEPISRRHRLIVSASDDYDTKFCVGSELMAWHRRGYLDRFTDEQKTGLIRWIQAACVRTKKRR